MRIGLNLLCALPEMGGGWNYIKSLVAALGECDNTNTYIVFVSRESECLVPSKSNFASVCTNIRSVFRPQRIVYENTILQLLARKHRLDCMHWFASTQALFNAVPGLVTIYDLQPFLNWASWSWVKQAYLRVMVPMACRRAAMLLPMSQATAQDLQRVLSANPARMEVVPPVIDPQFRPVAVKDVARFKAKFELPDRFWLYVAHMRSYKNHLGLLQAYHRLKQREFAPWPLVLRGDPKGAETEIMQRITQFDLERDVIILPRLEEADLSSLYTAASGLVFPSLYEGGGIPVVEAMACGCPVIASDIPSVREYAGGAVTYFDPSDPVAIEEAMLVFQMNAEQRERNRLAGLARAEKFQAQQVISRLQSAYSRVWKE